jgi:outer membrane protein assembly factor BamD
MKKSIFFTAFLLILFSACKSEFEKLRTTTDVGLLQKKGLEYYTQGDYSKAQTLFELVMPSIKGQPQLEDISYKYAYTHYFLRNYLSANFYFKNFAITFSASPLREEAEYMAAYSEYKQSPQYRLDQESTRNAIEGFQAFVNNFPESSRIKECNKLIDELRKKLEKKAFDEGELYYRMQYYQAAITSFENLLKEYPETSDAEQIRYLILKSQFSFAENSIFEKQLERYKLVTEKYKDFIDKFPKSKYRNDAEAYIKISNKKIKELNNVRYQIQSSKS